MKRSIPALLFLSVLHADASACSCVPMTVNDFVRKADAVHIATLQEAKLVAGNNKEAPFIEGRFVVTRTLKGEAQFEPLILGTPASDSECGVGMLVSGDYVIFQKRGQRSLVACDGSGLLGPAGILGRFSEEEISATVKRASEATRNQRPSSRSD